MAITIAEKVIDLVGVVRKRLQGAIKECACYVESLEQTHLNSKTANFAWMIRMEGLSKQVRNRNDDLRKFVLFKPELEQEVDQVDDIIEGLADRFMKWARRTTITVTEAMAVFSRSRSTIYRWIKAGKLAAQKNGRRWEITI